MPPLTKELQLQRSLKPVKKLILDTRLWVSAEGLPNRNRNKLKQNFKQNQRKRKPQLFQLTVCPDRRKVLLASLSYSCYTELSFSTKRSDPPSFHNTSANSFLSRFSLTFSVFSKGSEPSNTSPLQSSVR